MYIHRFWSILFCSIFGLPKSLVLVSVWNVLSKSLWTSTLGNFVHPKWRQQGCGHPLRTMFLFQDADAKLQESWSCIWLKLVKLYKLLFSLPPHCPGDCLIVLLKLSPLIPHFLTVMLFLGNIEACSDCSNEGNVQSSYKDAWGAGRKHQGCLNDLFNLPFLLICILHAWSLRRFAVMCFGVWDCHILYLYSPGFGQQEHSTLSLSFPSDTKTERRKGSFVRMMLLSKKSDTSPQGTRWQYPILGGPVCIT